MIQGLITLNYEEYDAKRWHGTFLLYAILLIALFVNTYLARILPQIEAYVLILHIVGFFCVLIPLVYLAPHHSANEVFATFTNAGGWENKGLSFFVGASTAMFAFLGVDAGGHMGKSPMHFSVRSQVSADIRQSGGSSGGFDSCAKKYASFCCIERNAWLFYGNCCIILHGRRRGDTRDHDGIPLHGGLFQRHEQ